MGLMAKALGESANPLLSNNTDAMAIKAYIYSLHALVLGLLLPRSRHAATRPSFSNKLLSLSPATTTSPTAPFASATNDDTSNTDRGNELDEGSSLRRLPLFRRSPAAIGKGDVARPVDGNNWSAASDLHLWRRISDQTQGWWW
ncbi:unnamed protein product [Cuscuta campestris]|uniref:Uncharacterized protein n=1 Tax=Cuscuta campestris TaxID=132261 RepID=A0A484NAP8_9ASTE|nr:unnamed protein product [Cuscuta campestris]